MPLPPSRGFKKWLMHAYGATAAGAACYFLIISPDQNIHKVISAYFLTNSFRDQNLIPATILRSFQDFLPGSDKRI
jgi:hypothetical protein